MVKIGKRYAITLNGERISKHESHESCRRAIKEHERLANFYKILAKFSKEEVDAMKIAYSPNGWQVETKERV